MQNKKYAESNFTSQSSVKSFRSLHPIVWKKIWIDKTKEQKETDSLIFGSLVDTLLFSPERVDELFISCEIKKPSDSVAYIIEKIFGYVSETFNSDVLVDSHLSEDCESFIVEYAKFVPMPEGKIGYGQGWTEQRLVDTIIKAGSDYFEFLKTTNGKYVVSAGDYMDALLEAE